MPRDGPGAVGAPAPGVPPAASAPGSTQPADQAVPAGGATDWRALLAGTEGRLLALGLLLTLAISVGLGLGLVLAPQQTLHVAGLIGLNLVLGRAAGMGYGIAAGLQLPEVVLCNLLVETAQVLVVYPLFVLGWQQLVDTRRLLPALAPLLARLQAAAESGRGRVRRYGIAGLFVFVFMPFWMTGPVVGAIIGFLLGLRTRTNLAVVLSATALAIVLYAAFLERVDAWASAAHPYAVLAIVMLLLLLAWLARRGLRGPQR